ncbi:tail fiber assembly protein, partial [Enterobacter hormaechei subsp. steigerwaltii]
QLIEDAGLTISVLQDAVDLGMATENEVEQLRLWKTYRIRLSRISTATAPEIEWPEPPSND